MTRPPFLLLFASLLAGVCATATSASTDSRGWSPGVTALGASRVLSPLQKKPTLVLPKNFARSLSGPTMLIYFSPLCPHCQMVQPELNALATRLEGRLTLVGVATGHADAEALQEYQYTFKPRYRIVHDRDGTIASAMGARSTPAALLITPVKKTWQVQDVWYPYLQGYDTLVEMRIAENPWSVFTPGTYQGTHLCAVCHIQETEAWTLTHHSIAWRTLVLSDKHTDPECTSCHVTGAGEPGGWDGDAHSVLVDVGCEACHGPGGPHDGKRIEAKETCEQCHDAKHSIAFEYEKGLPHLDHFRTVEMDDEAYRAARTTLTKGEADRPLLAFSEGKNVGSEACVSCHSSQHEWWSKSGHRSAYTQLTPSSDAPHPVAADIACVRCHATANQSGPPPTELAGYRIDEGVGCESCHGPGEAHVAAGGGKDNIQGLGESCPVCVLEALCTSCHTQEWDKDWDLDTHLKAIDH